MTGTRAPGAAPRGSDGTGALPIEEPAPYVTESLPPLTASVQMVGEPVLPVAPVGGPVWRAWREGTLTRAKELESQAAWLLGHQSPGKSEHLARSIPCHLQAARDAANGVRAKHGFPMFRNGSLLERAMSNLHAAEANLLHVAPADYVLGQMPCLLKHVQCHLTANDPRRQEFERIAQKLGVKDPDHPLLQHPGDSEKDLQDKRKKALLTDPWVPDSPDVTARRSPTTVPAVQRLDSQEGKRRAICKAMGQAAGCRAGSRRTGGVRRGCRRARGGGAAPQGRQASLWAVRAALWRLRPGRGPAALAGAGPWHRPGLPGGRRA